MIVPLESSTKPTICQVLHSLNVGGAEVLAREFARQSATEFRTVFACLDELGGMGDCLREEGYPIEVLGRHSGLDLSVSRKLRAFCIRENVSLLHAHQYTPFFYASLARTWRWRRPLLFTEHGRHYPDHRSWKRVLANQWLVGKKDRVVAVGQHVKNALIENEGIPERKIDVVYNGIDVERFYKDPVVRGQVRNELGVTDDRFVVLMVSRLNPLKDHATTLRAWRNLSASGALELVIVGDGEEREAIERMIDGYGLRDSVRLLGLRNDVSRLLNAADAYLMSSVSEGIPLTLIEAMAIGVPCVATDAGGTKEVIDRSVVGSVVPIGDDQQLAAAVKKLVADRRLAAAIGKAGQARVRQLFASETMHRKYHDLYRKML